MCVFGETGTMNTPASQADVGVRVQARFCGVRRYHRRIVFEIVYAKSCNIVCIFGRFAISSTIAPLFARCGSIE